MKNTNSTSRGLTKSTLNKLKTVGSGFFAKTVLPIVLCVSLLFNLTSCIIYIGNTNDTNTSLGSNAVNTDTGSSDTESSLNSDPADTSPSPEDDKIDISQYSELLQEILTDEFYIDLMNRAYAKPAVLDTGLFDPHPYAFLKKQGHDIYAIMNNELECRTVSYIPTNEPNNLYIATYVENPGNYFTEYMLRYTLTDKEIEDYHMLHYNRDGKYYIQAMFMNDVISKNKQETVISKVSVTKEMHKQIGEKIINHTYVKNLMNCDTADVLFHSYEYVSKNSVAYFYMYVRPSLRYYNKMYSKETIALIPMAAVTNFNFANEPLSFTSYNLYSDFTVRSKLFPDVVPIEATFFYPQDVNLYIKNDIRIQK